MWTHRQNPQTGRWEVVFLAAGGAVQATDGANWSEAAAASHASRLQARHMAMTASAGELADPPAAGEGRGFYAVLAIDEYEAADGRYFEHFDWEALPLSLFTLDSNEGGGHWGAEASGVIRTIERLSDGRRLFATGTLATTEEGVQTERQIEEQVLRFVSVDPADYELEEEITKIGTDGWPVDGRLRFTSYTIGGATVLGTPAIRLAVIWLEGMEAPEELTAALPEPVARVQIPEIVDVNEDDDIFIIIASASGATDLPIAERDHAWDSGAAKGRVADWAGGDSIDWGKYAQAFFYKDGDGTAKGDFGLPFADVIDDKLTAIPKGIFGAAGACQGARGSDGEKFAGCKPRIAGYYSRMAKQFSDDSIKPPWEGEAAIIADEPELRAILASAHAARAASCVLTDNCGGPVLPPAEWFADPRLSRPTPLQITPEGRVFGHIATWDQPHRGFLHYEWSERIYAPRNTSGYAEFLTKRTPVACCADAACGHERRYERTGVLTLGTGHAADRRISAEEARRFYENTGYAFADVTCGDDAFGVWVSGACRPETSDARVREFLGSAPSGDWRWVDHALELIGVLSVNSEGLPVRASAWVERGEVRSLVAGFGAVEAEGEPEALVASIAAARRSPRASQSGHPALAPGLVVVDRARFERMERDLEELRPLVADRIAERSEALLTG